MRLLRPRPPRRIRGTASRVSQPGAEAEQTSLTTGTEAEAGEILTITPETKEERQTISMVTEEGETEEALIMDSIGAERVITIREEIFIKAEADSEEVTMIIMMEIIPSMMTMVMMTWTWKMTTRSFKSKVFLIGEDPKVTI